MAALAAEAAASPPGAKGLVLLPYFSGERTPIHDPHAKGMLFGLNLTHTRADSTAPSSKASPTARTTSSRPISRPARTRRRSSPVGGGTKNRVWAQATSDISGRTQILREKTIGASYGDAFLAALAIGAAKPDDIESWNPKFPEIVPDPANAGVYRKGYGLYRELYRRTADLMREA